MIHDIGYPKFVDEPEKLNQIYNTVRVFAANDIPCFAVSRFRISPALAIIVNHIYSSKVVALRRPRFKKVSLAKGNSHDDLLAR